MNPVLTLTRNCFELTLRCVQSVFAQDIPVELLIIDNGSTDGTREWLPDNQDEKFQALRSATNLGVSWGWNWGLKYLFERGNEHVLVVNNDVVLPTWFYSELLSYNQPFVTGVGVDCFAMIEEKAEPMPLQPAPDFSAFLIRRQAWDTIGPFNENMVLYSSDCDYHIRGHRVGLPLWKANVPYFHVNSQTMLQANEADRWAIADQANKDRAVFHSIYGCLPGQPEYAELFKEQGSGTKGLRE